jgi:hypothetical protein
MKSYAKTKKYATAEKGKSYQDPRITKERAAWTRSFYAGFTPFSDART